MKKLRQSQQSVLSINSLWSWYIRRYESEESVAILINGVVKLASIVGEKEER